MDISCIFGAVITLCFLVRKVCVYFFEEQGHAVPSSSITDRSQENPYPQPRKTRLPNPTAAVRPRDMDISCIFGAVITLCFLVRKVCVYFFEEQGEIYRVSLIGSRDLQHAMCK
jgi:hypothetical protein